MSPVEVVGFIAGIKVFDYWKLCLIYSGKGQIGWHLFLVSLVFAVGSKRAN